MISSERTIFPAKLLLLGEHAVLKGSQALAIPFPIFKGSWVFCTTEDQRPKNQQQLPQLLAYLFNLQKNEQLLADLDLKRFQLDLQNGIFFESDIPGGYGLGSSGALCTAIYERYTKHRNTELKVLKKELAQIESFFHGSSSGIDPLIILLNQAVLVKKDKSIQTVAFKPTSSSEASSFHFFLLDTGISRKTAPYVKLFLEKCTQADYLKAITEELSVYNDQAIEHLLKKEDNAAFQALQQISGFQLTHFLEMIPAPFLNVWNEGLESRDFVLKLCGAGGGGFLLGMAKPDKGILKKLNEQYKITVFKMY